MARIRNPRYAPDFLERRLSPSSFGLAPRPAEISYTTTTTPRQPLPTDPNGDPIPQPTPTDGPGQPGPV